MTKAIKGLIKTAVLAGAIVSLWACSAIPTAEEYTLKQAGIDPNDAEAVPAYNTQSGLGTVNRQGENTVRCDRRRGTGSNIGRSSCRSRDSRTQPVREAIYSDVPPVIAPGQIGPRSSGN